MNGGNKGKGFLKLLFVFVIIAAVLFVAVAGIGEKKYGSMSDITLGLDLAGGVSITYQTVKENPTEDEIEAVRNKLELRAAVYSNEYSVYLEGENRINVDIPRADDEDAMAILEDLGRMATIYFIYGQSENGVRNISIDQTTGEYVLARPIEEIIADGDVVIDGSDIADAEPYIINDVTQQNVVVLTLQPSGTTKFAEATRYAYSYYNAYAATIDLRNIIAIVYDGEIINAPRVSAVIENGEATISGSENYEAAKKLSSTIKIGALPIELEELQSSIVGAKLGNEAVSTSLMAGAIGFAIVFIFMIAYYRIPGLASSIALVLYVGLIIISLNIFNVTLTLPGIAGIILSIGMAVDANVIIFSRIREELAVGKTVRASIKNGFNKAFGAIFDGNITTLIAAIVLYLRGSGTVRGFAQTLALGVILSMFTALVVTKFILNALFDMGADKLGMYGLPKNTKTIAFTKHAKKFALISIVLIVAGFVAMGVNSANGRQALNFGLDFMGGSSTQATFGVEITDEVNLNVRNRIHDETGLIAETSQISGENTLIIRTAELNDENKEIITAILTEEFGCDPSLVTINTIGSTVSGEMKSDALWAVIISTVCMLIYIWIRFNNINFAASAVIALVHDVLVVLTVYAVARISVGNTFIACMLTLVGYSINATIVIFDRIRENLKAKLNKETVEDIVNRSISQTITRSINTSLTTLAMVLMLVILGVDAVREFAVPLLAGIIAGAYSSVCITGTLWNFLNRFIKTDEEQA